MAYSEDTYRMSVMKSLDKIARVLSDIHEDLVKISQTPTLNSPTTYPVATPLMGDYDAYTYVKTTCEGCNFQLRKE